MNLRTAIGFPAEEKNDSGPNTRMIQYINLKLAALGLPIYQSAELGELQDIVSSHLANYREKNRLLADTLAPADQRISRFLKEYLEEDCPEGPLLPTKYLTLDQHGLARNLSLPPDKDEFTSDIIQSYRVKQGVLHNPKSDRRTTKGVFHIAEGGLPVPGDKKAVPRKTFARLWKAALNPPSDLLELPYCSTQKDPAEVFVSLLLRPVVCPAVEGVTKEKSIEVRFFAPGNMVCNLDFVESIFGNAGDPFLPENDAGLDVEHWSGHTGCVILAPHLLGLRKKDLGLPHYDEATERQRRDGMCWKKEDELYNDGGAFKITCRDDRGVMTTLIADNYFGYCKKEVKTQISYAANLMGGVEEEHAGGALVYPSYDLGEEVDRNKFDHTWPEVARNYGDLIDVQPEGYGIDRQWPEVIYIPENAHIYLREQKITWENGDGEQQIPLSPKKVYLKPSGYRIHMEKPSGNRAWRIIGTQSEPTFCHKPCTVSGGGKSEISKALSDAIISGPVVTSNIKEDLRRVDEILRKDFSDRFKPEFKKDSPSRPILSSKRSLGSVIKLLTPNETEYTDEYNEWLRKIPNYLKEILLVVKRFYKPEWGENWQQYFHVDYINGQPGNELRYQDRKLVSNYLRVGYEEDGSWRVFGLRKDFFPARKVQTEDDISASVVVPAEKLRNLNPDYGTQSQKLLKNCEYRLFQRPDEAIHRGYDKQTEKDFSQPGNFFSNYEPLPLAKAKELQDDAIGFDLFTPPMKDLINRAAESMKPDYFVSSAHPRIFEGKPSKNPRYLQNRPDLEDPLSKYVGEMSVRLFRRIPAPENVHLPVNAVLPGRRNNPPNEKAGIRALAVFNPIHYQELPELFMDFVASLTGKSPSTTGAGSEGAMTKGPFNAMPPVFELNNALVSFILTGHQGFSSAAGYVGPKVRVDHDVSLLIPEIWSRMTVEERDPKFLLEHGFLEPCKDFEHEGKTILASRLGYRITSRFVSHFFGRIFNNPDSVFTEEILKPEKQDFNSFIDGLDNIVATMKSVAELYFEDQSIDYASPPLKALLTIMKDGEWEGRKADHPEFRKLFTKEYLLQSDWYQARLDQQQKIDEALFQKHLKNLEEFLQKHSHRKEAERLGIPQRREWVTQQLEAIRNPAYRKGLEGCLGRGLF
ncbi:MAG: hypothetical protein LAT55_06740 [Opitutales bacterium]|nr:hypothetical protein [Opitutales bacterium]